MFFQVLELRIPVGDNRKSFIYYSIIIYGCKTIEKNSSHAILIVQK